MQATIFDFAFPFFDTQFDWFSVFFVMVFSSKVASNFVFCVFCEIAGGPR
jgi:hypothetical protein